MNPFDRIAEARIREALERGELTGLVGEGQPLRLDDDTLVPEELRAGYRILKNAGFIPPELQDRRDIRDVEQLLRDLPEDSDEYRRARVRLQVLRARTEGRGERSLAASEAEYREKLLEKLR